MTNDLEAAERAVVTAGEEWIDANADALVDLLVDLVARPGLSGDEGTVKDAETTVGRLWAFLEDGTKQSTLDAQRVPEANDYVDAPRDNVYATLEGRGDAALLCTSHTDVVAAGDPTAWPGDDPFAVAEGVAHRVAPGELEVEANGTTERREIRDRMDQIWERRGSDSERVLIGRGVYDNKASIACLVGSLLGLEAALERRDLALGGDLVHGHLVDEEVYQVGVKEMVGWESHGNWLGDRYDPSVDLAGVVLEGSYGFVPVVGHRGLAWVTLEAAGESTHASTPELGRNAVVGTAKALAAADEEPFRNRLARDFRADPMLGDLTVASGTTVVGGDVRSVDDGEVDRGGLNSIPDWCETTFDVRIPRWEGFPEGVDGIREGLATRVERAAAEAADDVEFTASVGEFDFFPPVALGETVSDADDHPLVETASATARSTFGYEPTVEVAPGVTDAAFLYHGTRAPTLVEYGPAGAWSHEPWEFVERRQVVDGAKAMLEFAVRHLGVVAADE